MPFYQHTHSRAVDIGFIFTHEATVSHRGVVPEKELIDLAQRELWPSSTRMQTPYDFEEERLTKAFMELPLKRRQVMELLFLADLSETETAKRLNCSLQYVRNQRCIALKRLRSRLMEGGDDE